MNFPENFLWGTATAAYQVEGARWTRTGADSLWGTFSHTPGNGSVRRHRRGEERPHSSVESGLRLPSFGDIPSVVDCL